jgi:hypothetical protein
MNYKKFYIFESYHQKSIVIAEIKEFNLYASIFSFLWFLYKKLYKSAAIILLINLFVNFSCKYFQAYNIQIFYNTLNFVFLGIFASDIQCFELISSGYKQIKSLYGFSYEEIYNKIHEVK